MNDFKSLFIHTPRLHYSNEETTSDINYSAIGLFTLVNELCKNGFESKILHLGIEKYLNKNFRLSKYVKENNIKFLAFSLQWNQQSYDVIETARLVKQECPDIFISLGGYTASAFAEEILDKYHFIDAIIKGEGELPTVKLVQALANNEPLDDIPNLYHRKNGTVILNNDVFVASSIDLDNFDFFNPKNMVHYKEYSKIPFILNYSNENQLTNTPTGQGICLGRGCLGNCVWCGGGFNSSKKISNRDFVSFRNPNSVISEIKTLKNNYNIEIFRFSFDPNPNDRSYLINLFEKLTNEFNGKLNVIYNMDGLPNKHFLDVYKTATSESSVLMLSPVFANEHLRKQYKSFFYTNAELEEILDYMDKKEISSEIYFSDMPGVGLIENQKSEEYAQYLKGKYKYLKNTYNYEIEIEPASPWLNNPAKYNLKNIKTKFDDYYFREDSVIGSFESELNK